MKDKSKVIRSLQGTGVATSHNVVPERKDESRVYVAVGFLLSQVGGRDGISEANAGWMCCRCPCAGSASPSPMEMVYDGGWRVFCATQWFCVRVTGVVVPTDLRDNIVHMTAQ
jgi:hypothetical protein